MDVVIDGKTSLCSLIWMRSKRQLMEYPSVPITERTWISSLRVLQPCSEGTNPYKRYL